MRSSKLTNLFFAFLLVATFLEASPVSAHPILDEPEQIAPDEGAQTEIVAEGLQTEEPQADEEIAPSPQILASWEGTASYYSEGGCVGCRADRRMANGRRFNQDALTLAFMEVPLGCRVRVINLSNGLAVEAEVTDTGGFKAYRRIADLSKGTKNAIGGSDLTWVRIDLLGC